MNPNGRIIVVTGLQYGSEGKGAIASYLSKILTVGARSGAANAGHTIYYNGDCYVMRQLPVAWVNPLAWLVIGIGSIISLDVLLREIELIDKVLPIKNRLKVDFRAHVVTESQQLKEAESDLAGRISSTSAISREGIGQATADKVLRKSDCLQAKDCAALKPYLADTVELLNAEINREGLVMAEGTQGFGLSLDHGAFPFVTSRDITASSIAASLGLSLHCCQVQVVGVLRTYPIRVAGNSGPFEEDSIELNWSDVAKRANCPIDITERTSVTKKIRRVATFSWKQFTRAVEVNRPTELALTFADYLDWSIHERVDVRIPESVSDFISSIEEVSGVEVKLVKTGPTVIMDFDHYRRAMFEKV